MYLQDENIILFVVNKKTLLNLPILQILCTINSSVYEGILETLLTVISVNSAVEALLGLVFLVK